MKTESVDRASNHSTHDLRLAQTVVETWSVKIVDGDNIEYGELISTNGTGTESDLYCHTCQNDPIAIWEWF